MIRGIGPAYALKLVRCFGESVFDVTEAEAARWRPVSGVAAVGRPPIADAWRRRQRGGERVGEGGLHLRERGVGRGRNVPYF